MIFSHITHKKEFNNNVGLPHATSLKITQIVSLCDLRRTENLNLKLSLK